MLKKYPFDVNIGSICASHSGLSHHRILELEGALLSFLFKKPLVCTVQLSNFPGEPCLFLANRMQGSSACSFTHSGYL